MIQPGYEWQVRELAAAAWAVHVDYRDSNGASNGARSAAYCRGVRDVLRLIVGDDDAPRTAELKLIYDQYLGQMDSDDQPPAPAPAFAVGDLVTVDGVAAAVVTATDPIGTDRLIRVRMVEDNHSYRVAPVRLSPRVQR